MAANNTKLSGAEFFRKYSDIIKEAEEQVDEAVRVMGATSTGDTMTRPQKGAGPAAQASRDSTAKMVKQARSDGKDIATDKTVKMSEPNKYGNSDKRFMKYDSKAVGK